MVAGCGAGWTPPPAGCIVPGVEGVTSCGGTVIRFENVGLRYGTEA